MRFSSHVITWSLDGINRAIEDLRTLCFHGFEAFAFVADDYGVSRLDAFPGLLARNALELVALYGGGNMHDPSLHDELVARNVRLARFLQANGAARLVLGPGRRPEGG